MRYDASKLSQDLECFASVKDAEVIVGGLSKPSKMPWYGWSISAKECKVGAKLAKIEGSVCHGCYALKGRYMFPNVQDALERRLQAHENPLWVPAFIFTLNSKARKVPAQKRYFRWFDSGDLQSVDMLYNINLIALNTPTIRHWLPTKESTIVRDFCRENGVPAQNMVIRISAAMLDQEPPIWWPMGSSVYTEQIPDGASRCPAPNQENACVDCRACWSPNVGHITYHAH